MLMPQDILLHLANSPHLLQGGHQYPVLVHPLPVSFQEVNRLLVGPHNLHCLQMLVLIDPPVLLL